MSVQLEVGSWGLFCGHGGRQIVLVDDQPCGPSSARKSTRRIPRELLLDENRIAKVYETGEAIQEQVTRGDEVWVVVVRPMLSPRSASLVGVQAGVFPAGFGVPEPPRIGGWEWEVERDERGQPTPQRRTYWDRELFCLYGVDPDVGQQDKGYWETGEWVSELIVQSDQMRVSSLVRDGIQEGLDGVGAMRATGILRCLTYDIVTGYGSESSGSKHLRLVGHIVPVKPADPVIRIFGFSHEAPKTFHDMAFVQDVHAGRVDDVLRGVMALSRDPIAVVDAETLDVLITSTSWRAEEFGHVGGLGDFAMVDDGVLEDFVRKGALDTHGASSMSVDLQLTDGSVRRVGMTVTGVRSGVQGHDAVIRLDL